MRKISGFILSLLLWATLTDEGLRSVCFCSLQSHNVSFIENWFFFALKKNLKIDFDYDNNNISII